MNAGMPETMRLMPVAPTDDREADQLSANAGLLWDMNGWRKCRDCGTPIAQAAVHDYCETCQEAPK